MKPVPLETSKAGKDVRFEQAIHVALKLVPLERSIPAGKEVKPTLLQPYHDMAKFVEFDRSSAGKEVKPVQPYHVTEKLVPLDRFKAGRVVSAVHSRHAPAKLMLSLASVENVTAGKVVKLALLQPCHALSKFVPLDRFNAGKDSSEVQLVHALVKLMSSPESVLNVTAGKEVRAVQPFHALMKLVPAVRVRAGKEVNPVQPFHAVWKLVPLDRSRAGKEVSPLQEAHVWKKLVPLDVSNNGKEVSPLRPYQAVEKLVTLDVSMTGKEVIEELLVHT